MLRYILLEVTDEGAVLISNKFKKQSVAADTIIISVGFKSNRQLYNELHGKITDLYLIGDAYETANIMDAIWSTNEIELNC